MKTIKTIAVCTVILVVLTIMVLSGYGLFSPVNIEEKNAGPYMLVYKKYIGDYKNTGLIMDEIYYDLSGNSVPAKKGFGLYYDNPQEVDKAKLRSIAGCIVEGVPVQKLKKLSAKYGVQEYPSSKSVVAEFPYKGKVSIVIGVFKVYPKLATYIKEHKYSQTPVMEIYDQSNEKIIYIASANLSKGVFDELLK